MSEREIKSVVVMHFDERGELTVHIADPDGHAVVLSVDDRCPGDRVYEHLSRDDPAEVLALAPRPWGNMHDDRHDQATARILRARDGLSVIEGGAQ
ncbi:MAG: hypothetical protein EON87_13650 [Brevundimonas sp.]|nr:MAG: hypothetical protein EON87_13650 [Brevundimonas sp.]